MFRKIVSNLNFSPALVGQLGFYAKRLRKEEATRRLGLLFTALALIVQSFAVFSPPEAANAASAADFVRGGVSSPQEFLKYYDKNVNHIKDIYNSLGITRSEIASTKQMVIGEASRYNWSLTSLYSYAQGQRAWQYDKAGGGSGTVFYRPMRLTQEGGDRHEVFAAYSKQFGWFAIKKDCGNLITAHPPVVKNPDAFCKSLTIKEIASDKFRMTTVAKQVDGAKINRYVYEIKNDKGKVIASKHFAYTKTPHSFVYAQATPGVYKVQVTLGTSEGPRTGPNCHDNFIVSKQPAAFCSEVTADIADRTIVTLGGSARAVAGATISKYTFIVKDKSGKEVKRVVINSTKRNVTADSFTIAKAGKYTVQLSVKTSEGVKTGADCTKPFTIQKNQICAYNPSIPADDVLCQPCPDNPDIWINDDKCTAKLISTKKAVNMSQGNIWANSETAQANDKITYTVSIQNKGLASAPVVFKESLTDILEYARLIDIGGATYDKDAKTLTWPATTLKAGESQRRTFAIQIMSDIPATNTGKSDAASYDCTMVNTFGNSVAIDVACPTQKVVVEQVTKELPHTGPRENMIFAGVLLAVVVYFYARSRQLGKEVRLIRHNLNTGTI
jgi:uncharacterized repeat protein (TIGR01451 family)